MPVAKNVRLGPSVSLIGQALPRSVFGRQIPSDLCDTSSTASRGKGPSPSQVRVLHARPTNQSELKASETFVQEVPVRAETNDEE